MRILTLISKATINGVKQYVLDNCFALNSDVFVVNPILPYKLKLRTHMGYNFKFTLANLFKFE